MSKLMAAASTVYEGLLKQAMTIGEQSVRIACKEFLKKKTVSGVEPTIRKAVPRQWTEEAFIRQRGICKRCGEAMEFTDAQGDHIMPLIKGGEHHKRNIQALHSKCNQSKGSNDMQRESKVTGKTVLQQLTQS